MLRPYRAGSLLSDGEASDAGRTFSSPDGSDEALPPDLSILRPCFSSTRPSARPFSGCSSLMTP